MGVGVVLLSACIHMALTEPRAGLACAGVTTGQRSVRLTKASDST